MIAEVRIYLANWRVGDWATVGTLAACEIGSLVKTGYLMKTRCLMMSPKGEIARRTMSVCTQQCMAVFWVRKRCTTCDMWMLISRWNYANRSCMNILDWQRHVRERTDQTAPKIPILERERRFQGDPQRTERIKGASDKSGAQFNNIEFDITAYKTIHICFVADMKIQCVPGCSTTASLFGVFEYPEKRHCCSCIVYVWILTVSGMRPGDADRGPLVAWARGAVHSSIFNMDRTCAIAFVAVLIDAGAQV